MSSTNLLFALFFSGGADTCIVREPSSRNWILFFELPGTALALIIKFLFVFSEFTIFSQLCRRMSGIDFSKIIIKIIHRLRIMCNKNFH